MTTSKRTVGAVTAAVGCGVMTYGSGLIWGDGVAALVGGFLLFALGLNLREAKAERTDAPANARTEVRSPSERIQRVNLNSGTWNMARCDCNACAKRTDA